MIGIFFMNFLGSIRHKPENMPRQPGISLKNTLLPEEKVEMFTKIIKVIIFMFFVLILPSYLLAEEEQVPTQQFLGSNRDQAEGEITRITKDSILLLYKTDKEKGVEYEAAFPINKNVELVHFISLSDLKVGDMVRVSYEDAVTLLPDNSQKVQRKTKSISFIKAAAPVVKSDTLSSVPK